MVRGMLLRPRRRLLGAARSRVSCTVVSGAEGPQRTVGPVVTVRATTQSSAVDRTCLTQLMSAQEGVVSRRQVHAHRLDDSFIESRIRRKDWARVHRGVYVDHTGPPTWKQRAWAAVLVTWPSALCHESALVIAGLRSTDPAALRRPVIHVAVDQSRRVGKVPGVRIHRVTDLAEVVQPSRSLPRVRLEHALLDVASGARDDARAIAVLADACQAGRTSPARLTAHLRDRIRLPRRRFLLQVLEDVAAGAYSVLEHRYLTRVERPHGLPTAERQRRVRPGRAVGYRDVEYLATATIVELDGRLGHEWQRDRWDDLDRDLDSAVAGDFTVRLGWQQILDPCRTAAHVFALLTARGWSGELRPCGSGCAAARPRDAA